MDTEITKDLIRKAKNSYHRTWQKQNPDKVRQAQERYWKKKVFENQEKQRKVIQNEAF